MIVNIERVAANNQAMIDFVKHDLGERPFLLISEYIPSLILFEFGSNRANSLFSDSYHRSREVFIQTGRMMCMDIFLNNSNRMPFLWPEPGNPNNILFHVSMDLLPVNSDFKNPNLINVNIDNIYAVDTKPNCLDPQDKIGLKNLGDYLNKVAEMLKELFYEMKNVVIFGRNKEGFVFKSLQKFYDFFNNTADYTPSNENLVHFVMGFIIMLSDLTQIKIIDLQEIIEFIKRKAIGLDWGDEYKSNSKLINIDYFKYILEYFKQLSEENDEIIKWVKDVTFDFYACNFHADYKKVIDKQKKFTYVQKPVQEKPVEPKPNEEKKEVKEIADPDVFNVGDHKDKKKFRNDVHNGVFDLMNIDPSMILGKKKKGKKYYKKLYNNSAFLLIPY